jgi:hypothetical protein
MTRTQAVGLPWTRVLPVAEICTCTTHHIHNRQTCMPPVGFEPAIPASEFYALDRAATGIGRNIFDSRKYLVIYTRVACRKASRSSRKLSITVVQTAPSFKIFYVGRSNLNENLVPSRAQINLYERACADKL